MHQNYEKFVKSVVFEAENPLKMGPDLRKFRKKKMSNQPFLEGGKSLEMGLGFQNSGRTPRRKIIRVPPGDAMQYEMVT